MGRSRSNIPRYAAAVPHPEPRAVWHPESRHVGRRVLLFSELPSTNDTAASLAADPANAGAVVVADFQTRGRGQYGRVWQSRPGASLLLSALLFPHPAVRRPVVLTAWAAVAVGDAIRALTGVSTRIKWPNDLLVGGKKVCGILIEQGAGTVVGIGLNLNQTAAEFTETGLPDGISLGVIAGKAFDPEDSLRVVLRHLDDEYVRLIDGGPGWLESRWRERFDMLNEPVIAELAGGESIRGRIMEMGFDGIALDGGEIRILTPEAVRQVRKA